MLNQEISRESLINDFVEMMNSDNATIFIGAGLSKSCGLPDWRELMNSPFQALYNRPMTPQDNPDLYDIADRYVQLSQSRVDLENIILRHIPQNMEHYKVSDVHRIIARLPLTSIWTTNWDPIIEKALIEQGKKVTTLKRDIDFPHYSVEDVKVYKVHGCIKHPESLVVTKTDIYKYYRQSEVFNNAFFSRLAEDTFLFLGFSFNDINLKAIIGRLYANYASSMRQHYAVLKKPESEEEYYDFSVTVNELAKLGIRVYSVDDYSKVNLLLKDIERESLRGKVFISGSHKAASYSRFDTFGYKYNIWPVILSDSYYTQHSQQLIKKNKRVGNSPPVKSNIPSIETLRNVKQLLHVPQSFYVNASTDTAISPYCKVDNALFPDWIITDKKHEIFVDFLHKMGERIIAENKKIFSGYGEGVCDNVVGGATKKFFSENKDFYKIYNSIRVVPLPAQRELRDFNSAFYRSYMLGACGFMIITKGSSYSSDHESGTFEEYNIARSLCNTLNNKQRLFMNKLNKLFKISYNQHFDYELTKEQYRRALLQIKPGMVRQELLDNIDNLVNRQSKIIFYKYQELYDTYSILFNEQWKIVLTCIEQVKASLCVFVALRDNDTNRKVDFNKGIYVKCRTVIDKLLILLAKRGRILYRQFKFAEPDLADFDNDYFEEILMIAKSLNEEMCKIENLPKGIKKSKQKNGADEKLLKKVCKIVNGVLMPLLKSEYKYSRIYSLVYGFMKTEVEYSSIFFENDNELLTMEKVSKQKLGEAFCQYEDQLILLITEIVRLADTEETAPLEENLMSELVSMCRKIRSIKLFNEIIDVIKSKSEHEMQADHNKKLRKLIRGKFLGRYFNSTNFFHDACPDDFNGDGKEEEIYQRRRFLLIYRVQIYKLIEVIAGIKKGVSRIENHLQRNIIARIPAEREKIDQTLFKTKDEPIEYLSASQIELEEQKIFSNTDHVKYNPFVFDPNDVEKNFVKQKNFLSFYDKNVSILQSMQEVKRIMDGIKEMFDPNNKKLDPAIVKIMQDSDEQAVERVLEEGIVNAYNNIVTHVRKIFELDSRDNSFKSEPYRSATIIIPVAAYGGMAKKIWENERFRFEVILNMREEFRSANFNSLLSEFYNLYNKGAEFLDPTEYSDQKLMGIGKSVESSIFHIINFFDKPSHKKDDRLD